MPAITISDLNNAKLDVDHIADIATSTAPTATDRTGSTKLTVQGAVDSLKSFNPRGAFAAGATYAIKDVYTSGGLAYVAVVAHTSMSVTADLASGKVTIHQGATREELAAASGADLVGFQQEGAGAVRRSIQDEARDRVSVKQFGVSSSAGDGARAQIALNKASALGVQLSVNAPTLLDSAIVSDATSNIVGEGLSSAISVTAAVVTDAITIRPSADGNARENMKITGLYVLSSGAGAPVKIDLASDLRRISRMTVSHSLFRANAGGVTSAAFYVNNSTKKADKFALATFEDVGFDGGLVLLGGGDSIKIDHCTMTGVNAGIYADLVTNVSGGSGDSSLLTITNCNSTANKGIHIFKGTRTKIQNNNLEGGAGPGAQDSIIFLEGGVGERISNAEVTGNYIAAAPNVIHGLKIGSCDEAYVANNTFGISATGYGVFVTADAKNTRIGPNIYSPSGTGREVLDSGVGTMGITKSMTLLASWVAIGYRKTPSFIKSVDGVVSLSGCAAGGSTADGTIISTLPAGMRPSAAEEFVVRGFGPAAAYFATVIIDPAGAITLSGVPGGGSGSISFSGISFFAPLA